jgi:hypothetical protein
MDRNRLRPRVHRALSEVVAVAVEELLEAFLLMAVLVAAVG